MKKIGTHNNVEDLDAWLAGHEPGSSFIRARIRGDADITAIEKVEPGELLPGRNTYECLQAAAKLHPEKTAITLLSSDNPTEPDRTMSYKEYLVGVTAAANLFATTQGAPCVVAMMLPILPESLLTAWGGCTAGVLCPINPFLEPDLVISILNSINATTLVTTQSYGPSAADQLDKITQSVPTLEHVWLVDSPHPENDFFTALQQQPSDKLTFTPSIEAEANSIYLPTGGTTGTPKIARLNNHGQLLSAWIAGAIMGSAEDEVIGVGMPLFHVGGLIMLSLRGTILGQSLLLLTDAGFRNRSIVDNLWEISRRFGMTSLIATPTSAAALLNATKATHTDHKIRTFTCGGSTVPVELGKQFAARFGVELREVWGATEFHGFLGCMPNDITPVFGSVGLRTPFHDVRCFDLDENNRFLGEVAPGECGVIVGKGPCVSSGYISSVNNAEFFVVDGPDGAIWGSSGDLGYIDNKGYIWITGRQKDVIIRGGHNIDPRIIEEALASHPSIQLAAAIGYPDPVKGELPTAYVQLIEGKHAQPEDLIEYCKTHVPERAAVPVDIQILSALPLTAVGKIFKPALRQDAIERAVRNTASQLHDGLGARLEIETPNLKGKPLIKVKLPANISNLIKSQLKNKLNQYPFLVEFID